MDSFYVQSNNISLKVYTYGSQNNAPIVLVHGYPDNHSVWASVASILANHFYVIAYDVRGSGQSQAPRNISEYNMQLLSDDLKAVVDSTLNQRAFHLVGHDWGSIQSWESVTADRPIKKRILSYTTISGPCLDHMGYWLKENTLSFSLKDKAKVLKQAISSWYVGFFHIPLIPSYLWQIGLGSLWPIYLRHIENVSESFPNPTQTQDGSTGVKLYQANFSNKLFSPEKRFVSCPVQLIVPTKDNYVGTHLFDDLHLWTTELYKREIDANHWVPLSHPNTIAKWIREFVNSVETKEMSESLIQAKVEVQ